MSKLPNSMSGLSSSSESAGTKLSLEPKTAIIIALVFVIIVIFFKITNLFGF